MNHDELSSLAEELRLATIRCVPVDPPSERFPDMTLDDAYEVQLLQVGERQRAGANLRGHKVGLTSSVMQRQLGVSVPDYGRLLNDMFWLSGESIARDRFLQPRIEAEIAVIRS